MMIEGKRDVSNTWQRYWDGLRVPGKYGLNLQVTEAETRYPGSSTLLSGPFWSVMTEQAISTEQAIAGISEIGDPIRAIILGGGYNDNLVWPSRIDSVFDELERFPDFEMLQGLVLMLGWADALQNLDMRNSVSAFYLHMIPYFIDADNIPYQEEVFDAVDRIAFIRRFEGMNKRNDVAICWKTQLPRLIEIFADKLQVVNRYWTNFPKYLKG